MIHYTFIRRFQERFQMMKSEIELKAKNNTQKTKNIFENC